MTGAICGLSSPDLTRGAVSHVKGALSDALLLASLGSAWRCTGPGWGWASRVLPSRSKLGSVVRGEGRAHFPFSAGISLCTGCVQSSLWFRLPCLGTVLRYLPHPTSWRGSRAQPSPASKQTMQQQGDWCVGLTGNGLGQESKCVLDFGLQPPAGI